MRISIKNDEMFRQKIKEPKEISIEKCKELSNWVIF